MTGDGGELPAAMLPCAPVDPVADAEVILEAVRDPDGRISDFAVREANPAACAFFGLDRAALTAATLIATAPGSVAAGVFARCVQCIETGEPQTVAAVPYPNRQHSGVRRIDVRVSRVNPDRLCLTWRDATDRYPAHHEHPDGHAAALRVIDDEVSAEQAAVRSDARFRRLIESSAIATNLVSPDGRFRVVNPAMCDLVGYDADTADHVVARRPGTG